MGGSSPEAVLNVAKATRLTGEGIPGDESAGFFQPAQSESLDPARRREAYSWGGLTSRSAARALWLVLAPFAMANLAGWMIEHDGEPTEPTRILTRSDVLKRGLARLIALSLTIEAFFLATRVALDQFALQCGGRGAWCGRWWLQPLAFTEGKVGRNLVVGMMFPIGLVGLVGLLTRRSQAFLHRGWLPARGGAMFDPAFAHNLTHPEFWAEPDVGHRLGIAHVGAGFATIGLTLTEVLTTRTSLDLRVHQALLLFALVVSAFLVVRLRSTVAAGWTLLAGTMVVVLIVLVLAWSSRDAGSTFMGMTSPTAALDQWLFSLQVGLIALFLITTVMGAAGKIERRLLPTSLMIAAAGLILAFGNGFTIAVAALLGEPVPRGGTGASRQNIEAIYYGQSAGLVASVFVLALLAMSLAGLFAYVMGRRSVAPSDVIAGEYAPPLQVRLAGRIRRARALARLSDQAPAILGAGVLTLVGFLTVLLVSSGGRLESRVFADTLRFMHGFSSGVLIMLPVVGAVLVFQAYRAAGWRRVVGVVWDVTTFWPRWFHPFAPPSYGERAIPDLERRLGQMVRAGEAVVVSAHSQGSLLAVAALAIAPGHRVGLVTHGSPIHRLYARFFPEYLGGAFIRHLRDRLDGRWVNLYRLTDYIGGTIPDCGDDRLLPDPLSPDEDESLGTHLGYDRLPPHTEAIRLLAGRL